MILYALPFWFIALLFAVGGCAAFLAYAIALADKLAGRDDGNFSDEILLRLFIGLLLLAGLFSYLAALLAARGV